MQGKITLRSAAVLVLLVLVVTGGPVAAEQAPAPADDELALLVSWMSGSFSSKAQAEQDEQYLDIRLRMAPIWTERTDGLWLYVEQAVAQEQARPYRQRVYRLSQLAENLFESSVYLLPDDTAAIGAWKQQDPLAGLSPEQLTKRAGCSILLRRQGESFHGSTLGRLCESTLRGAAYATSVVTITADEVVSWDRGYDAANLQVWGAEQGGYRFIKLGDLDADEPFALPAPMREPGLPL